MNGHIANGCNRHVQLQRLPVIAVIERDIDAQFRSGKEQALLLGVLANRVHRGRSDAGCYRLPGLAVVAGAIDVRLVVVQPMAVDRRVRHGGTEARRLDHRDSAPIADTCRRDILPGLAVVEGELDKAGVTPPQISSAFNGDGAILNTTPKPRSFVFCTVTGPAGFALGAFDSAPVRSGLIFSQCRPPSVVFITYCVPRKSVLFSIGEKTSIGVHGPRYLRSLISVFQFCTGHGEMSWLKEVRRS